MQAGRGEGWRKAWEPQGGNSGDGRVARAVGGGEGVRERGGRGREAGVGRRGNLGAKEGEGEPEQQGLGVLGEMRGLGE